MICTDMKEQTKSENLNTENQIQIVVPVLFEIGRLCVIHGFMDALCDGKSLILYLEGIGILNRMEAEDDKQLQYQENYGQQKKDSLSSSGTGVVYSDKCQDEECGRYKNQGKKKYPDFQWRPCVRKTQTKPRNINIRKTISKTDSE